MNIKLMTNHKRTCFLLYFLDERYLQLIQVVALIKVVPFTSKVLII